MVADTFKSDCIETPILHRNVRSSCYEIREVWGQVSGMESHEIMNSKVGTCLVKLRWAGVALAKIGEDRQTYFRHVFCFLLF